MERTLTTPGRTCGTCRLCCKLLPVHEKGTGRDGKPYEFLKPARRWCEHSSVSGCAVHSSDAKPWACRVFSCLWLQGFGTDDERPDRSHVVIAYEVFHGELHLMLYASRDRAGYRDPIRDMVNAILSGWISGPGVSAVMMIEPDRSRRRLHRDSGWQKVARLPGVDPDVPGRFVDADRDRRNVERVMGAGFGWHTTIDYTEVTRRALEQHQLEEFELEP